MNLGSLIALDLGTTKFCLARINSKSKSGPLTIDTVCVAASGMKRGMLSNFEKAQNAVSTLLELGEREFGKYIDRVVIGVAGSHLKSRTVETSFPIENGQFITKPFLKMIRSRAKKSFEQPDREILHIVPVSYQVDSRGWIRNPLEFSGSTIFVKYFLIEADKNYLRDIVRLCNKCGVEVIRLIAEPLASASVVSGGMSSDLGVAVADIGGGTTDGIIYEGGRPVKLFNVNIGGDYMTSDLAIGLGIPYEEAERVKLMFGVNELDQGFRIEVKNVKDQIIVVQRDQVMNILGHRIYELGELLIEELMDSESYLKGGLVLTGGGADIKGLPQMLSGSIPFPIRKGSPTIPSFVYESKTTNLELNRSSHSGKYATVAGLLYLEILEQILETEGLKHSKVTNYFRNFAKWVKELS